VHPLLDGRDEAVHLRRRALSLELHAAIGQVADEAGHVEFLRNLQGGVAEAHTLHTAGEEDGLVMHVCHAKGARYPLPRGRFNPQKSSANIRHRFFLCVPQTRPLSFAASQMSKFNSDGAPDNEWDERGELAWNEFDWERYLREQDEAIGRYLSFYESSRHSADRIDEVADKMGWHTESEDDEAEDDSEDDETSDFSDEGDVYTLHKNPIFISTKAIYRSLRLSWETLGINSERVPQPLALGMLASLHRGEEQALQAIYALDFGDYAMAVSLFKRALAALNGSLALLNSDTLERHRAVLAWRDDALPRLFDLREVWLRVIAECRDELNRPVDEEN
jgi:hypothetical protein